jgi:hypothetical protein
MWEDPEEPRSDFSNAHRRNSEELSGFPPPWVHRTSSSSDGGNRLVECLTIFGAKGTILSEPERNGFVRTAFTAIDGLPHIQITHL